MNQLASELRDTPRCQLPPEGGQCYQLLVAMKQGRRFTVLSAIQELGIYALSQRCGELRNKYGWEIQSRTRREAGKSFSEYWLDDAL